MENRDFQRTAAVAADELAQEPRPYLVVAERIRAFARRNGIGPGERLPPERILEGKLNVGRARLREALIAPELGGIIDVRGGSGVYLRAAEVNRLPFNRPGRLEVLSTRHLERITRTLSHG